MGNEARYLNIFKLLFQDGNLHKLDVALHADDKEVAFEAAHTFKCVEGNLGLAPLYDAVCVIAELLRTGEERDDYQSRTVADEYQKAALFYTTLKGESQNV